MSFTQKKTQNPNNSKISNLWIGFGLGMTLTFGVAFFLGTKKGREMLKKILEVSEHLEEDVLKMADEVEGVFDHHQNTKNHTTVVKKPLMGNVLDKMKTLIPHTD